MVTGLMKVSRLIRADIAGHLDGKIIIVVIFTNYMLEHIV